MKLKSSLRGLSILAAGLIASTAFANNHFSSVPQELYPGPVSASASPTTTRAEVRADLLAYQNQHRSVPQELYPGPAPTSSSAPLSRAEVRADLHMWLQAGMGEFSQENDTDWYSAEYERRMRHYQELRQSPAFTDLVNKLQSQS